MCSALLVVLSGTEYFLYYNTGRTDYNAGRTDYNTGNTGRAG